MSPGNLFIRNEIKFRSQRVYSTNETEAPCNTLGFPASILTFLVRFGACRWVLAVRPAGRRGGVLWQTEDGGLHESTPAVAEPPLATSCDDLAVLAD